MLGGRVNGISQGEKRETSGVEENRTTRREWVEGERWGGGGGGGGRGASVYVCVTVLNDIK